MKKIFIITISHRPDDSRVYQKIGLSLAKQYQVIIFHNCQIDTKNLQPIRFYRSTKPDKAQFFINAFRTILKEKPNLIICVEPITLLIGNLSKMIFKIPFIYDCHEFFAEAFSEKFNHHQAFYKNLYQFIERSMYRKADGVVTVNQLLVNEIIKYQKNTIYCGNYPHKRIVDQHHEIKQFDLIYIGGISRFRGLDLMLEAISELKCKNKHFSLLIIGKFLNKDEENYAFDFIKTHQLDELVQIHGFVSSNHIMNYIQQAKIGISVLNPSINRYRKAIPLKLLEYMQFSLPVIANDFPIIKDIVEQNHCGYTVSYDKNALINAICKLTESNETYHFFANNANHLIQTYYNWQNEETKLFNLIHGILK